MSSSNIEKYGYDDFYQSQITDLGITETGLIPARIIEVQKEQYKIVSENGEKRARLKGSVFYDDNAVLYPAIGDFVLVKPNPYGEDTIYYVMNRKSKFSRLDSFYGKEQVVAANFDYVFIMTSLNNDFNLKRIERYLTAAWQSGASPIIVLTKTDLCDDYTLQKDQIDAIAPGVPVIAISSHTGEGINELRNYIQPFKTIVFLGSSGVGKSSLVNVLMGEEKMAVNSIREDDSKGRHTTAYRQLIVLQNGAMIIDTPGMRELGMWVVSDGLDVTFSDIEALSTKCRFRDCNHINEPGCAIKSALERGEISEERWKNYIKLKKEASFAERKENANMRSKEKLHQKGIAKLRKNIVK